MSMFSFRRDCKMIRHFYPVGHGAFYVEEFNSFYIVYDCGTLARGRGAQTTINKRIKPIIENEMDKNKPILALFISHFDADHVNGIDLLSKHCKIKNIFFPFRTDKEINILEYLITLSSSKAVSEYYNSIIYKIFSSSFDNIIVEGTHLYAVRSIEDSENNESNETIALDENGESRGYNIINSGREITISSFKEWIYIPYNFDFYKGQKDFIKEVNKRIPITKGKTDEKILQIIEKMLINAFTSTKEKITECFGKKGPEINKKSLVVYSGPPISQEKCHSYSVDLCYYYSEYLFYDYAGKIIHSRINANPGCLYLGDCNVKDGNYNVLISKYQEYIKYIGIVQIPHHGSIENSDNQLIEGEFKKQVLFVISASSSDKKHPAISIIESLLINFCNFKVITEINDSLIVACIN